MLVPLLDLSRQHAPLAAELEAAALRVLRSGRYVLGEEVAAFEAACAQALGAEHALGVSSGTDALLIAMMALDIGPGDEVLCPAFTFFGTAGCIVRLGATPVWVDVEADTFNLNVADAAAKVSKRTKAILPVHLFGQSAAMDAVLALADAHGLHVLEDAAQAIGARFGDRPVGTLGAFGAYSFYPTKNLGGFGDGGLLVTNDTSLFERARRLRNHGMEPKYVHHEVGGNFRLDALQAALLAVKLPHLAAAQAQRRALALRYGEALAGCAGIEVPREHTPGLHAWNQCTLRVDGGAAARDALRAHLTAEGIGTEVYYPQALPDQPCFQGHTRGADAVPVSRALAASVLSLPLFPGLTEAEQDAVIAAVRSCGAQQRPAPAPVSQESAR